MIYLLSILAAISAGIFKGFRDAIMDNPNGNRFAIMFPNWAGPDSWRNKYRYKGAVIGWLIRGPLVAFTDARHLFELLHLSSWQILVSFLLYRLAPPITGTEWDLLITFFSIKIVLGSSFEVAYMTKTPRFL